MGGCTVGVIRLGSGILFFKNRDMPRQWLANRIVAFESTPEFHVLRGVNLETMKPEGVSIGVNRHRICVANTHIASTTDTTYDLLCERLVREVTAQDDVRRVVEDFMAQGPVQGGRILVASLAWAILVEVYKDVFRLQEIDLPFVMTNGFSLISHDEHGLKPPSPSSVSRLEVASSRIGRVSGIGELKALLRSHLPERELSICNHGEKGGTESSHIVHVQGDYVGWSSLVGSPCENDYNTVHLFQGSAA